VRSDNLCLRDGHAVLLDWNHARIGNAAFDIAFWLPSLVLEGLRSGDARAMKQSSKRNQSFLALRNQVFPALTALGR